MPVATWAPAVWAQPILPAALPICPGHSHLPWSVLLLWAPSTCPGPSHPPRSISSVSSQGTTQPCPHHSALGTEEKHLGKGGFEGSSLNLQAMSPLERACPIVGSSLSFLFGNLAETQEGAGRTHYFWPELFLACMARN